MLYVKEQAGKIFINIKDNGRGYGLQKTPAEKIRVGLPTIKE